MRARGAADEEGGEPFLRSGRRRAGAIAWKIVRATTPTSANWARLNALLTRDWFRSARSATPGSDQSASR